MKKYVLIEYNLCNCMIQVMLGSFFYKLIFNRISWHITSIHVAALGETLQSDN